jgi:hypothetical protein
MALSSALAKGTSSSEAPPELAANTSHDGHQTLAVGSEFLCDFVWRSLRDGTQQPSDNFLRRKRIFLFRTLQPRWTGLFWRRKTRTSSRFATPTSRYNPLPRSRSSREFRSAPMFQKSRCTRAAPSSTFHFSTTAKPLRSMQALPPTDHIHKIADSEYRSWRAPSLPERLNLHRFVFPVFTRSF